MEEHKTIMVEGGDERIVLPTILHVGKLNKKIEEEKYPDVFADRSAETVNELEGTSAVFKRNVTNTLKKYQRGRSGVGTKQVHEKTFDTAYDTFDCMEPPYNLDYLSRLYVASETHFAASNAKASNIVGLGFKLVETRKTKKKLEEVADNEKKTKKMRQELNDHLEQLYEGVENFNEEDTFTETLVKTWKDYEATGNGYIEIGRNKDGTVGYLGHVPAKSIRIRRNRDGFVQLSGWKAQYFAHFGAGVNPETGEPRRINNPIGGGQPNEIIHIKKYAPTSTYYGVPDIIPALKAVAGNEFAQRFNLDYFENKAIPRYAIILKGATLGTTAQESLLSLFETGLKGQNHRSVFIPLPPDTDQSKVELTFESIESGVQDSSFKNYVDTNNANILMVHRVPITKVSVAGNTNLAIARDADKTFKEQVCAPEQRILEKKINRIFKELTDAFEFKLNEMTLTDADTQSKIDERAIKNGWMLANEIRARDGLPGIKGGNERVDPNQKVKDNAERARDSERKANATDSAGEARNPKGDGRTTP